MRGEGLKGRAIVVLATLILFFSFSGISLGRIVDGVLLNVNGEGITFSEFREFVSRRLSLSPGDADLYLRGISSRDELEPLLGEFIDVMLIRKKLKELGESVSDEDVEGVIRDIISTNDLTREQFEKALEEEGLTMEAYKERLREDMEKSRIVRALKGKEVMVTDDEVREYYLENEDRFLRGFTAEMTLLSLDLESAKEKLGLAALRGLIARADEAASRGASLDEIAGVFEREGIEVKVSEVGPVGEDDLRGEMSSVVEDLRKGEVSGSVLVGGSVVYVRLDEKKGGVPRTFDEVKEEIREKLVSRRSLEAIGRILDELRKEYYVEVRF